jgi:hypothetical protein
VEESPGRLVAVDPQLPLELESRQARRVGGHQVRRPEPERQGHPRPVKHGPRRNRCLVPARLALPQPAPREFERLGRVAPATAIAIRPPACREVGSAGSLVLEPCLELLERLGEVRAPHACTLPIGLFGVNPIGRSAVSGYTPGSAGSNEGEWTLLAPISGNVRASSQGDRRVLGSGLRPPNNEYQCT